jgi:DNA helicase II / ATP-dependent DNA helicase PcrA
MLDPMATAKAAARTTIQLDDNQRAAIEHVQGPVLVIAGAGTGKTTVLTRRIAHLIRNGHAQPNEILALTYADNAAAEMRERVQAELQGTDISGLKAVTFHAYCNELLKANGRGFGLLDDKDLWIYLRRHIRDLQLSYFVRAAKVSQFLDDLIDFSRRCHDELVGPEKYAAYVQRLERRELPIPRVTRSKEKAAISDDEVIERCREISRVFTTAERLLQEKNYGTFSHMITRAYELLRDDSAILSQQQNKIRYILVDEFQDANFAQVKILSLLSGSDRNVFAVGDPDQAIYHFRGAASAAFGLFHRTFPASRQIVLGKNQRSTTPILQAAFAVIDQNPPIFANSDLTAPGVAYRRAPLQSARDERALASPKPLNPLPAEVVVLPVQGRDLEASDILTVIKDKQRRAHCRWSDFAILYRTHTHRDLVVRALAEQSIPFTIENLDVMETPEIRDLLACLNIVHSTRDATSLVRVAAFPQFHMDPHQFRAALRARARNRDDAASEEAGPNLEEMLASLRGGPALLDTVRECRREIASTGAKVTRALTIIARGFQLPSDHPAIRALFGFAQLWEDKALTQTKEIGEFLEYLADFRDAHGTIPLQSTEQDAVRLMTAHAAKGLEFNHVFIIRANTGTFPCSYHEVLVEFPMELRDPDSVGEGDGKVEHNQEERRLFYVAMTRARDSLTLYAKEGTGKTDKTPAGLLRDLLKKPALKKWIQSRPARAFQTDLFGAEAPTPVGSRTSDWVMLPPASLLNRLSASAVATYEKCPLQFKLDREWKLPSDDPAAMQYGSVMHSVLRAWSEALIKDRPLSESQLLDLFSTLLASASIEDPYQHELYERQGFQQLRDFLANPPASKVLHTEEGFEMRMGDAIVTGRIDRIDDLGQGRVAIVDYKTGKPRSQEDADESLQLSIYALAAQSKWGYQSEELILHNLDGNSSVVTRRSPIELETAKHRVASVMAQVEAGQFHPTPGSHCQFCAYRSLCPATEKPLPIAILTTN